MLVKCPNCGERVVINGLGRKRLDIPLKNISESLQLHHNIEASAQELHCSQGYIFNILKANGLMLNDIINKGY